MIKLTIDAPLFHGVPHPRQLLRRSDPGLLRLHRQINVRIERSSPGPNGPADASAITSMARAAATVDLNRGRRQEGERARAKGRRQGEEQNGAATVGEQAAAEVHWT